MNQEASILIVDDDRSTRKTLALIFAKKGYETEIAATGQEAIEKAQQRFFNLALLDIKLPDMEGVELLTPLKEMHPDTVMIMVTAYASLETAVQALNEGASAYITKPLNMDEVLATVRGALEKQRLVWEKRQVEQALRESEQRLKEAQAMGRIGNWEFDIDTQTINWSDQVFKLYERDLALGPPTPEEEATYYTPEQAQTLREYARCAIETGEEFEYDLQANLPSGKIAHFSASMRPIRDKNGHVVKLFGTVQDITDRKRAEEALRASEERFALAVQGTNDGIWDWDIQHNSLYWSPRMKELLGYADHELDVDFETFDSLLHPDDREHTTATIEAHLKERGLYDVEQRLRTKSGEYRWFRARGQALWDESGNPIRMVGSASDITHRKQHERELEAIATVSAALRTAETCADMLPVILDQLMGLLNADGVALAMRHPSTEETVIELARGDWIHWSGERLSPGEGISGQVIATGQAYVDNDMPVDPLFGRPDVRFDLRAVACVSLSVQEHIIGALWVGRKSDIAEEEVRLLTAIADMAANAIHRAALHEQTQRRLLRLTTLREIDVAITASLDLRVTLSVLLDKLIAQLGVDAADILLFNPHIQTLEYAIGRGFRSTLVQRSHVRLGEGLAGRAALERQTIFDCRLPISDLVSEQSKIENRKSKIQAEGFVACCAMPLIAKGEVKGVLEIFHRAPLSPDSEWMDFLQTLAGQAAIAIDNAELFEELQRSNVELTLAYDTTLEGWARALELRDYETEGHAQRVLEMTLRLARAMGMGDTELAHVRRGALLHDIGKLAIPDAILFKPGALAEDEWCIMCQHPVFAHELLSPIAYLRPALDIPYCHHEKWDGTGYPRGLQGEQIPLAARVFAVVDVWDALLSDRPYRPAWSEDKVLEYIRDQAGKHFDPQVVEMFMEAVVDERVRG
jgi:PAS domain S-box-containing protein